MQQMQATLLVFSSIGMHAAEHNLMLEDLCTNTPEISSLQVSPQLLHA